MYVWAVVTLHNNYVIGDSYGLNRIHRKIHMDTHTTLVHTHLISTDKSKETRKYSLQKPKTQNQSALFGVGKNIRHDQIWYENSVVFNDCSL